MISGKKEIAGVKDPSKLVPVATTPLKIMKTVFYCAESPTFTFWTGSHKVKQLMQNIIVRFTRGREALGGVSVGLGGKQVGHDGRWQ
jgi:hypothetical protein